jgi:serine/threonine protein phosphatase 1
VERRTCAQSAARSVDWPRALPARYDDGSRVFVHVGVEPQIPLNAQSERDLLWIREPFLSDGRGYARLVVHGHTPQSTGKADWRGNRLNLDTGAVYGGPLTAAVFTSAEREPAEFSQRLTGVTECCVNPSQIHFACDRGDL